MPGPHAGPERQLLHGPGAVLRHSPAILLLEGTPEYGAGPAWATKGIGRTVGTAWRMGHRSEDLVLSAPCGWLGALLRRPAGFVVQRPAEARAGRRRTTDGQRWSRASVVREETTGTGD
jgi:hypothetical protein